MARPAQGASADATPAPPTPDESLWDGKDLLERLERGHANLDLIYGNEENLYRARSALSRIAQTLSRPMRLLTLSVLSNAAQVVTNGELAQRGGLETVTALTRAETDSKRAEEQLTEWAKDRAAADEDARAPWCWSTSV